jgi:hypothetical protein
MYFNLRGSIYDSHVLVDAGEFYWRLALSIQVEL